MSLTSRYIFLEIAWSTYFCALAATLISPYGEVVKDVLNILFICSGNKYMESHLVDVLQSIGMWDKVKYKIVENHGDISDIDGIPEQIKSIFKTSFTTSPYGLINVAARAQKYVDQAISRNMYLDVRDINQVIGIYTSAWQRGLKSTYYLHMKPRHSAEQSTTKVNKASSLGFQGFSKVSPQITQTKKDEAKLAEVN